MKQNIEDNIFQEIFTSLINLLLNKRGFKVKYNQILGSKYILCKPFDFSNRCPQPYKNYCILFKL